MNIEFYTPSNDVKEWIIGYVRDAILKLHQLHQQIGRAEVRFKERSRSGLAEKICEIDLSIFEDSVMVTGNGDNFDIAARRAVEELNETVSLNFQTTAEPPDQIISTVDV